MEEGEIISILYNFIPTAEKQSNYFRSNTYPKAIQRYKNGDNLKKSKNIKDLYIIGEALDVDGDCGGYNLAFAFLSGINAGESIKND